MAMARPTAVMAINRVAELTAIFFLSGWSPAVIASTARRTNRALSKPSSEADTEEDAEEGMSRVGGRNDGQRREGDTDEEQSKRPESH